MKINHTMKKLAAASLCAVLAASCASVPAGARTLISPGDLDKDTFLTSNDALTVLRLSLGIRPLDNVSKLYGDVDGDGVVNSGDALMILRESIGVTAVLGAAPEEPYTVNDGVNDLSSEIFKRCCNSGENSMISPLSIYTALSMAANGAGGKTKEEMNAILGNECTTEEINEYLNNYITNINNGDILRTANSLFVMEDNGVVVDPGFVDLIRKDYFAEVFYEPANNDTVDKINAWVGENTKGMIDKILEYDSLNQYTAAHLLNAVSFEAQWEDQYTEYDIKRRTFNNYGGSTAQVDFLCGIEDRYLSDDKAVGFMKDYSTPRLYNAETDKFDSPERYCFLAILPNENVGVDGYIEQMNDTTIKDLVASATYSQVNTAIPKFSFDSTYALADVLKDMGMKTAFDMHKADFSHLATHEDGNIYISSVTHKTHIELDENGTKAAAVTDIGFDIESEMPAPITDIILDRPFIFVIYDRNNNIPVFIGTVCEL